MYRGMIKDGKKDGYGEYFHGKNVFAGNFIKDIPEG